MCRCQPNGFVSCTESDCNGGCLYEGLRHGEGTPFPSADGCRQCEGGPYGDVSCSPIGCGCDYGGVFYEVGQSFSAGDGRNTCSGTGVSQSACAEKACPVGCEQDAKCPQWFDCVPPASCDRKQLEEAGPHSGIAS